MTDNGRQEAFWVLRAQSGDREAVDRLLRGVEGPLGRYLSGLVGNRAPAEDLLQDVLTIVYRKLRWLQDPALFRPWVFRIASREAFKRLKRERRWSEQVRDPEVLDAVPDESGTPATMVPGRFGGLMAGLSPASRAVLVLHYHEGMTLTEIADVLEIAPGTVKSRLAYGLAALRQTLGPHEAR
ncbi:MAG TPA: RNA polymerase sigma factor [Candidatus Eisenbacteria bacterium]